MTYTRKAPSAKRKDKSTLWRGLAAPFVLAIVLAACSPRVDMRGNAIHLEDVATIEVGDPVGERVPIHAPELSLVCVDQAAHEVVLGQLGLRRNDLV